MDKVLSTLAAVVIAVGVSGGVWIGANMLFAQAGPHWRRFSAIVGGILGLLAGMLISGNRLTIFSSDVGEAASGSPNTALGSFVWVLLLVGGVAGAVAFLRSRDVTLVTRATIEAVVGVLAGLVIGGFLGGGGLPTVDGALLLVVPALIAGAGAAVGAFAGVPLAAGVGGLLATLVVTSSRFFAYGEGGLNDFSLFVWLPLVMAGLAAAVGWVLAGTENLGRRRLIGAGGGAALGLLAGVLLRTDVYPTLEVVPLLGWTVALAALGAGIGRLRNRAPEGGALIGAALGVVVGGWGYAELGAGDAVTGLVLMVLPFALLGLRAGLGRLPTTTERMVLDNSARAYIFLGPALFFVFVALVIPTIRTLYLSLLDRRSEEFVGLGNYVEISQDTGSFDASGFGDMFFSRPMIAAIVLGVLGVALALREKRNTGSYVELGGQSIVPIGVSALLFFFALFTALRGTLINNLWWVVVVVVFSTALGLAVAVLADNVRGEKIAKSIIFMPMALSLVGASIIWRFMYLARDISLEQTGMLNALWVGAGRMTTEDTLGGILIGVFAILVTLGVLAAFARSLTRRNYGAATMAGFASGLLLWFTVRWWGPGGLGGVEPAEGGGFVADTVFFIQEGPYNNLFLMLVFVWIQTGFAMVIFSAAIRAVPEDLIEAARVDGANESQVFWRVTLPQISPTIVVIVTTLIVGVMKVFDIVKVMTNGQFGTQVLANDMFNTAFTEFNTGEGAALAILILISVLPVMIYNLRELMKED